jgi:hypothetical protein
VIAVNSALAPMLRLAPSALTAARATNGNDFLW